MYVITVNNLSIDFNRSFAQENSWNSYRHKNPYSIVSDDT